MNITSRYTPPMYSFASSSRSNTSPLNTTAPLTAQDRDAQAQRALLGESAYLEETDSPSSPLNTPSPTVDGMSPLSVASHLQDACNPFQVPDVNPFLDGSWKTRTLNEADHEPVRLVTSKSSPKRQIWSVPVTPEPSAAMLLPTIQEAAPAPPPALPPRPKTTPMNATRTYTLPSLSTTTAPTSQMRRRPSPFPLGPVPAPPPQRRARYEPRPHIVDLATEQFGLKTPTISTATQLQQERERQWQLWESERIRSLEMTKEAAKNNRAQAPSRSSATPVVQEKPVVVAAPAAPAKKVSKRRWWCFGGGAVESDSEEIHEKEVVRSASRLSSVSGVSDDEDEEDWEEARTTTGITGLLGFGCASRKKAGTTRQRATLKKRAQ